MRMLKRLPVLAAAMLLAAMMLPACQQARQVPAAGPDRSAALKATALPALSDGKTKSLDQYNGTKGMLAVFVDTNCPFAEKTVGGVDTAAAAITPHGVSVVLVNMGDDQERVKDYYLQRKMSTPVLYDTTRGTHERWNITEVPTLVLVDASGKQAYFGHGQWEDAARAIESMLGLKKGAVHIGSESTGGT